MTVEAELPDGRILEFPDGTDPSVVQATVKKMMAPPAPPPGAIERLGSAAAKGAFTGGGLPGAVVGTAGEIGKLGQEAYDKAAYGLGGKATDVAAKVLPPEGAAAVGYGTNVATQALPVLAGSSIAKAVSSPLITSGAKDLMQRAVKPSFDNIANGNAAKAIETMLEKGINASEGGMAKLQTEINRLKGEVTKVIANSPAEIDRSKVANELLGLLDRVQKQASYKGDVKKVEAAFDEFMSHPLIKGDKIPIQLAQDMKKAGNRKLDKDFGELSDADKEAQKALVRGLKEGIVQAEPSVGPLNAKQAELLNALKVAQHRSLMSGNKDVGGISLLAEGPAAGAASIFDRSALMKSLMARILNANSGTIPTAGGGTLGALLGASSGTPPPEPRTLADILRRGAPAGRVGAGTR